METVKHPKCPLCQQEHSPSLKICPKPPGSAISRVLPPTSTTKPTTQEAPGPAAAKATSTPKAQPPKTIPEESFAKLSKANEEQSTEASARPVQPPKPGASTAAQPPKPGASAELKAPTPPQTALSKAAAKEPPLKPPKPGQSAELKIASIAAAAKAPSNPPKPSPSGVLPPTPSARLPLHTQLPSSSPSAEIQGERTSIGPAPQLPQESPSAELKAQPPKAIPEKTIEGPVPDFAKVQPPVAGKDTVDSLPTQASEVVTRSQEIDPESIIKEQPQEGESLFAELRKSASHPALKAVQAPKEPASEGPPKDEPFVLPPPKGLQKLLGPVQNWVAPKIKGREKIVAAIGGGALLLLLVFLLWPKGAPTVQPSAPANKEPLLSNQAPPPAPPEPAPSSEPSSAPAPAPESLATVQLSSTPEGARVLVWIDDTPSDTLDTPTSLQAPLGATVTLVFASPGFAPQQQTLKVSEDKALSVDLTSNGKPPVVASATPPPVKQPTKAPSEAPEKKPEAAKEGPPPTALPNKTPEKTTTPETEKKPGRFGIFGGKK